MRQQNKVCAYLGLGHMGLPVYRATRMHFQANHWRVVAIDIAPERRALVQSDGVEIGNQPPERATIVFVGVRPQEFFRLAEHSFQADIVVSMMAGLTSDMIRGVFPGASVVRIIPNTPCEFGMGVTPIYAGGIDHTDPAITTLYGALSHAGSLLPLPEERMIDWATGISAGGPAYVMYIAEAMIDAGLEIGFSPAEARALVAHTLAGSAKLLLSTDKPPARLAAEVMTPNGTTERGIRALEEHDVAATVKRALLVASARARELSGLKADGA